MEGLFVQSLLAPLQSIGNGFYQSNKILSSKLFGSYRMRFEAVEVGQEEYFAL